MPQFEFARVALPQIAWLLVTFGILFLMMRAMLPKVAGVAERRAGTIGGDLDAAEKARLDAEHRREAYEAKIAGSRDEAQSLIGAAKADAAKANEARMKAADEELAATIAAADADLATARSAALKSLDAIAVDATQDIVERLTGDRPLEPDAASAVASASA
ncbi:MAG: ATPase [Pseudomonadota bacterium]